MPNPTSGFQLSALPQPLSFPTNIGTVDVGQMQKAYANAMQNVQDTALFGQRVAAQRAALDYQEQLARSQQRLISPMEAARTAELGATTATKTNEQRVAEALGPLAPEIAKKQQQLEAGKTSIDLANIGAMQRYASDIAELRAQQAAYQTAADAAVQLERYRGGGFIKRELDFGGGLKIPYYVDASGHIGGLPQSLINSALSKVVIGENVRTVDTFSDSDGNQFAVQRTELVHPGGGVTTLKDVKVPLNKARKEGFVQYRAEESNEPHPEFEKPQSEVNNLRPLVAPTGNVDFGNAGLSYSAQPNKPLAAFGAVPTQPKSALAAQAQAPTPQNVPAEQPAPAQVPTPAPATQPQTAEDNTVPISWLRGQRVQKGDPADLVNQEFENYWKTRQRGVRTEDKSSAARVKLQTEVSTASEAAQEKLEALKELANAAKIIEEKGVGTGAWQQYVPAGLLQLMGDASKQSYQAAVNELINKLSADSRFKNFTGVTSLIGSTKPTTADDPKEVGRKVNYLYQGMSRVAEMQQAANEGLRQGIAANPIRNIITSNYTYIPYDEWRKSHKLLPEDNQVAPTHPDFAKKNPNLDEGDFYKNFKRE